MNDDLIKKNYLKKIELFQKYNKYYYDKNKPKVSDKEYDQLKAEILLLENSYVFLKSNNSPSHTVDTLS